MCGSGRGGGWGGGVLQYIWGLKFTVVVQSIGKS